MRCPIAHHPFSVSPCLCGEILKQFKLPDLGEGVHERQVIRVLVKPGVAAPRVSRIPISW
jgi:hypothetical protein